MDCPKGTKPSIKEKNMEELLKKVVNLGIGAFKSVEENLEDAFKKAETGINDLISKGNTANDENSQKVRKFVDELLVSVKEYEAKAKEISDSVVSALKEFDPTGGKTIEDIKAKIESLSGKVKSQK